MEPRYTSEDPFEDEYNFKKRPKWSRPRNNLESMILRAVGRKFYKSESESRAMKSLVLELRIASDMVHQSDVSWIEECCGIATRMREHGKMIQLKGLMTLLNNKERRFEFYDRVKGDKKNKPRFQKGEGYETSDNS
jgi:hypothetical protein